MKPAVAYLRTSSSTNVGEDKDSDKRQLHAIKAYAKRAGYRIEAEYYDAGVSGADPIDERPGFRQMMEQLNGTKTIIVEAAHRFARDIVVQETGVELLRERGIDLIAADAPEYFQDDSEPTRAFIRQVLGAASQMEKAMTVRKLKQARDRKSAKLGKRIEGRKSYAETDPELIKLARRLKGRKNPKSLRKIAAELAEHGYTTAKGNVFSAAQVKALLEQRVPRKR